MTKEPVGAENIIAIKVGGSWEPVAGGSFVTGDFPTFTQHLSGRDVLVTVKHRDIQAKMEIIP